MFEGCGCMWTPPTAGCRLPLCVHLRLFGLDCRQGPFLQRCPPCPPRRPRCNAGIVPAIVHIFSPSSTFVISHKPAWTLLSPLIISRSFLTITRRNASFLLSFLHLHANLWQPQPLLPLQVSANMSEETQSAIFSRRRVVRGPLVVTNPGNESDDDDYVASYPTYKPPPLPSPSPTSHSPYSDQSSQPSTSYGQKAMTPLTTVIPDQSHAYAGRSNPFCPRLLVLVLWQWKPRLLQALQVSLYLPQTP